MPTPWASPIAAIGKAEVWAVAATVETAAADAVAAVARDRWAWPGFGGGREGEAEADGNERGGEG